MKDTLQQLVDDAKIIIPNYITKDFDFFVSGIDKFTLSTIPDNQFNDKEEPDFGVLLPESGVRNYIHKPEDIIVHYIHIMCHKKCKIFWKTSAVPYYFFRKHEIEFIEEMYNQRLMDVVAPLMYDEFIAIYKIAEQFSTKSNDFTVAMNTVLTKEPSALLPEWLHKIHKDLYSADPLLSETFNEYIKAWFENFAKHNVREIIKNYEFGS
jgi:hypothetical protein